MEKKEETITIPLADYNEMNECMGLLRALEEAGVDNWEGYSYALRNYYGSGEA